MSFYQVFLLLFWLSVLGSVLMCLMFYFSMDPLKASMYLVLSLIFVSFILSFGMCVWYSYYVCLVFLSGVFIIMVYFSSLSNFSYFFVRAKWFSILLLLLVSCSVFMFMGGSLGIGMMYYDVYFFVMLYLIVCLVFFLNFVSYFLVWGVALRSM